MADWYLSSPVLAFFIPPMVFVQKSDLPKHTFDCRSLFWRVRKKTRGGLAGRAGALRAGHLQVTLAICRSRSLLRRQCAIFSKPCAFLKPGQAFFSLWAIPLTLTYDRNQILKIILHLMIDPVNFNFNLWLSLSMDIHGYSLDISIGIHTYPNTSLVAPSRGFSILFI